MSMSNEYRVPRLALSWLLLTQCFLLLPHMFRFPLLVIPAWLLCTFWRVRVFQGRWPMPPAAVKVGLVIFAFAAIIASQGTWLNVEGTVCTLLLAFLLKLIELKKHRDFLITVYLAYFVIVTELLFSQSILSTLYMITGAILVTSTLIAVQSNDDEIGFYEPFKSSARIFVFSLPVMLVAFLVFPRLEPLWLVPKPESTGTTGISGSMSPGMISSLAMSDELAFRVEFDGEVPDSDSLYWRGVVLTHFNGLTWTPMSEKYFDEAPLEDYSINAAVNMQSYRVIMEPTHQQWLFTLAGTVSAEGEEVEFARDFTAQSKDYLDEQSSLSFNYFPKVVKGKDIYRYHRAAALKLPEGYNPKAQLFARQLREQSVSDREYIARILMHFRNEAFYYTLQPPVLGKHTVDEFLFETRQGFCEHYSSAFVVLMRSVDIPARVVAGYQGGEVNPYENYLSVRQMDAHGWAEVWLQDEGWVRVDPTYAVAPERIDRGSQQALAEQPGFLSDSPFSPRRFEGVGWIKALGHRYDQLNYIWSSKVLSYRGDRQKYVLDRLLNGFNLQKVVILVLSGFVFSAVLLLLYVFLSSPRKLLVAEEKYYQKWLRKLARGGMGFSASEGAFSLENRAIELWPEKQTEIESIVHAYTKLRYAKPGDKQKRSLLLKQLRRDVMRFNISKKNKKLR